MADNEIKREQDFIDRIAVFKKRTTDFFANYENPTGSEDRLEICLIRDGCRAVTQAEEIINRQAERSNALQYYFDECLNDLIKANAEIEALKTENKQLQSDVIIEKQNYEHIKELRETTLESARKINIRFVKTRAELKETQEKLEALLCEATGGKLSKHSYTAEVMTTQAHEHLLKCCEDERTAAVKEFAERYERYLLSQLTTAPLDKKEWINFSLDELDNLKKEMVGES